MNAINDKLFNSGVNSKVLLKELKEEENLDYIIDDTILKELFKQEITNYLDILFEDNSPYYEKREKVGVQTSEVLSFNAHYILALYSDNEKSYLNLPVMIMSLIKKLNIEKYKYATEEDIKSKLYQYNDILDGYNYNLDIDTCRIIHKTDNDKYVKYEYKNFDINSTDYKNKELFSIWAEWKAAMEEYETLYSNNINYIPHWTARDCGDGYGYDILSIDKDTKKEKLIEEKSGEYEGFTLTDNEVKVMRSCHFKGADYYIYKYTYDSYNNTLTKREYIYDYKNDILIDQDNNYYKLNGFFSRLDDGNIVHRYNLINYEPKDNINDQKITK